MLSLPLESSKRLKRRSLFDIKTALFNIELAQDSTLPEGTQQTYNPGSVIQGKVHLSVMEPTKAQGLKLVFRGEERFHKGEANAEFVARPFLAIKTYLWGSSNEDLPKEQWPTIRSGDHTFNFSIQLPMVNYPPPGGSNKHTTVFFLRASLERPNTLEKLVTDECYVSVHPFLETKCLKGPTVLHDTNDSFSAQAELQSQACLAGDTVRMRVQYTDPPKIPISKVRASLHRIIKCTFDKCNSSEDTKVTDISVSGTFKDHTDPIDLSLKIPLDSLPSVDYSRHVTIEYSIHLTLLAAKRISSQKCKFIVPLVIGTLSHDISAPRDLIPFTQVPEGGQSLRARFIDEAPLLNDEEEEIALPLYQGRTDDPNPPRYEEPPPRYEIPIN